jgi:hypothetical protein
MGKGYAEGPAAEEAEAARERGDHLVREQVVRTRRAVLGSTKDGSEQHFLGWADEVDADELFASGRAWGIKIVEMSET